MIPRAITGLGVASSIGVGADAFFQGLKAMGRGPIGAPPQTFDPSAYPEARVAEVLGFEPAKYLGDKGLRTLDRLTKLLVVAARLSLHHAGIKQDNAWAALSPEAVGVCCSNAYGSLEAITELDRVAQLEDARYINPAKFPNTVSNSASGYVSIWEELRAVNVSVSDGNCGGLDAIACADMLLSSGRADVILTGGGEAMSEALFVAFAKLGLLGSAAAGRAERATPTLGEGAAFLALESAESASERGARVLGEVLGYGAAFVAPASEATLLFASREALARAIRQAVTDAALGPSDIDIVASGASGISAFDDEEFAAIAEVLGSVAVAAPKLSYGETLGAGGTLGVASALAWFDGAPAGPLVRGNAPGPIAHVLVTSLGYYGNASAVVVRRARAAA